MIKSCCSKKSNSLLSNTPEFISQYSSLYKDKSTGRYKKHIEPPDVFDGIRVWGKKFLGSVKNQGNCGSCWAFASTDCLSMRISLLTNGKINKRLSPASIVFCNLGGEFEYKQAIDALQSGDPVDYNIAELRSVSRSIEQKKVAELGCQGETLIGAWQYLYRFGVTEEECVPYTGGYQESSDLRKFDNLDTNLPTCSDVLGDSYDICPISGKPAVYYRASHYYYVAGTPSIKLSTTTKHAETIDKESTIAELYGFASDMPSEDPVGSEFDIRKEIYHWGPVTSGIIIHDDFMSWDGKGVYKWDGFSPEQGGHAIIIVGWGIQPDGTKYWQIKNSWGNKWGQDGYFNILRGQNECGIEENVFVGVPEFYGFNLYLDHPILFNDKDVFIRGMWYITDSGIKRTTYTAMLDGTLPWWTIDVNKNLYDSNYWPDLSTFVAARPGDTKYPLKKVMGIHLNTKWILIGSGFVSVLVLIGGYAYYKNKK
jgi:hypothetical protein